MIKLLGIKNNKPFNYGKENSIQILKDICCLYINTSSKEWQISLNDNIESGNDFNSLKAYFSRLVDKLDKANRSKSNRKIVIFINRLGLSYKMLINLINENIENYYFNESRRGKYLSSIYTKHFIFRNFSTLAGKVSSIWDLDKKYEFNSENEVSIIRNFVNFRLSQGFTLKNLDLSFAACTQKAFYKKFSAKEKKELVGEIMEKKRAVSRPIFKDLMKQNNSGFLGFNKEYQHKIVNNVFAFDISSSYPSQFIKGNDFPIGHIVYSEPAAHNLKRLINNDKWFLAVFSSDYEYRNGILNPKRMNNKYYYFINKYDYKCLRLLGKKFCDYKFHFERLLVCDEEGYLNTTFRTHLHNAYLEKQSSTGGKRYQLKTEIDTLYGKGIQQRSINNINPINYYKNEEHYICPQFSFHALSRARFELISIINKTKPECWINSDTDCIKTTDSNITKIIEERNKEIIEENKIAGFDSDCGTWKFEGIYPRFLQLCNKVYCYEENNKINCTFAGCLETAWKEYFKERTIDESFEILSKDKIVIPGGVKQIKENNDKTKEYVLSDYIIKKEANT